MIGQILDGLGDAGPGARLRQDQREIGRPVQWMRAFAVGVGEMRHQRDLADSLHCPRPFPGGPEALRRITEPVHAAVHFQLNIDRLREPGHFQHPQLFVAMHRRGQAVAIDHVDIRRTEKAFQQQDGPRPTEFTQLNRFFEVEKTEAVGCAQSGERSRHAVAIRIGLDHGPYFGFRRVTACDGKIAGECGGVDRGGYGARHGSSIGRNR